MLERFFRKYWRAFFVRDLQHCFGRGRFVAIVHSPNEGYMLVHGHAYDPEGSRATDMDLRPRSACEAGHTRLDQGQKPEGGRGDASF